MTKESWMALLPGRIPRQGFLPRVFAWVPSRWRRLWRRHAHHCRHFQPEDCRLGDSPGDDVIKLSFYICFQGNCCEIARVVVPVQLFSGKSNICEYGHKPTSSTGMLLSIRSLSVHAGWIYGHTAHWNDRQLWQTGGRIFSHVRPFYEWAVSNLDP